MSGIKEQEVGNSPVNTSLRSANEGTTANWYGTRRGHFPFDRGKRRKRAVKTFHRSSISARGLGKTGRLGRDQENRYLESAVLMEPHNRSCWFDGRAYSYAAEHLRGVVPEEGDRLGIHESRQEDELLNNEDSTFRSRRPSSVEVSTEPPRELEESSRDDLDIEAKALSTEDEASAPGIFDSTWQDGSGNAVQFWHDEGVPSWIVLKFRVCGWPEDT